MFIRAMVRIFSFGERWNVPFNSAVASLNGTFHLSPNENILTIARINIHYLYTGHTRKNLTSCSKSVNKPSATCVRTACIPSCQQVWNNLLTVVTTFSC